MSRTALLLVCEHRALFDIAPPRTGEQVYCVRCQDMRRVVGPIGDWLATCGRCRFHRVYMSLDNAGPHVRDHVERTEHVVTVAQIGGQDRWQIAPERGLW